MMRSIIMILVSLIIYEPLITTSDALEETLKKHVLQLEDISLISTILQNCTL